ncbi:SPT3 Dosage dependent suppressor of Ty-induced promoter mutations-like protein [Lunasporangiospora selenospora]|uniref:SPT3 Dosage dependent suppressor of Ty-induced promoter mutations-like protein n=1 Tax=Lunasporangiospora selenospora TaxID=979761 RepID=A0A9P6KGK2_9FUNG|nr:SPT3 Dosage dependent suppressor of Ty-induced promoter mutations-like protein [Lunasporangiospora selenospora]
MPHRLNVKTHVFKKELQEYIPTQIEDRLRIETIIYVELSIVDQATGALVLSYDYARLPKDLFFTRADKVMSAEEMSSKRILNVEATLQCPSNGWQEEKEACLRCARRMSAKLDQTESRIMHMLPELHRTEDGDSLISFRNGVANIQFKINCYCGHKKEKEGFVIRFDSTSDSTIASHVTLPLMFYHQNKNRVASRALAAAKAQGPESQQQQLEQTIVSPRNVVKSVNCKSKREPRSKLGHSPIGHQIPSPPNSLIDSPIEGAYSPEMEDFLDNSDIPFAVPSPPPPDPLISLFPDQSDNSVSTQSAAAALISHMTPNSGPTRGGTMVTIHGSGFKVGEIMYVCFGENVLPIIPQRDHMLECFTPAAIKAEIVPVFAMNTDVLIDSTCVAPATFTYVDDNEKELMKLALQRLLNISAGIDGPLDGVLGRANEFTMWNDLLTGNTSTNEDLARDLLARGVDKDVQDNNGMTALLLAQYLNFHTMVDLLSETVPVVVGGAVVPKTSDVYATQLAITQEDNVVAHRTQKLESPGSGRNHDPLVFEGTLGSADNKVLLGGVPVCYGSVDHPPVIEHDRVPPPGIIVAGLEGGVVPTAIIHDQLPPGGAGAVTPQGRIGDSESPPSFLLGQEGEPPIPLHRGSRAAAPIQPVGGADSGEMSTTPLACTGTSPYRESDDPSELQEQDS